MTPELRPLPNVIWNLFLAVVPVVLGFVISHLWRRGNPSSRREAAHAPPRRRRTAAHPLPGRWWALALVPAWLAFLPNTAYLLTEWRHYLDTVAEMHALFQHPRAPDATLDLLLLTGFYVFYSGCGLLCLFLAVWPLDRLARRRWGTRAYTLQALVFLLCGLGVYLGLVPRFNSWDILHIDRAGGLLLTALQTLRRPALLCLMAGFSGALWLAYTIFDMAMDGAQMRLTRRRRPIPVEQSVPPERWHHALK